MAYVVVVFCLFNGIALVGCGAYLWIFYRDLPMYLSTAVQEEIRKQDDRIEKRVERARGPAEDAVPTAMDGVSEAGLVPGRPYRRE